MFRRRLLDPEGFWWLTSLRVDVDRRARCWRRFVARDAPVAEDIQVARNRLAVTEPTMGSPECMALAKKFGDWRPETPEEE